MNDPNLSNILKWGIENSQVSQGAEPPRTQLKHEDLLAFFASNRKSDADYMRESMAVIQNEEAKLADRIVAFRNLELLIDNLDNANNLENLGLWMPLVEQLENKEADLREFAAGCCSTAVQNNIQTQERLLIVGAIPILVRMATTDAERQVRKKAINAISSFVRNFQPGLDAAVSHMPSDFKPKEKLDANDMQSVDVLINKLRDSL